MITAIKKISPNAELLLVLLISFGLPVYVSIRTIFLFSSSTGTKSWTYLLADKGLYTITLYELIVLSIIIPFLMVRNWRFKEFNLQISLRMIGAALLLLIARNVISNFSYEAFSALQLINSNYEKLVEVKWSASLYGLIPVLIVNSIFEELLVVGYLF